MDAKIPETKIQDFAHAPSGRLANMQHRDPLLKFLTRKIALIVGSMLAAVSVVAALREMLLNSMDFQWSGARLLLEHRDPWAIYLAGDPKHEILLVQIPNYLHELFVLMLPFGLIPFAKAKLLWAVCNLVFVGVLGWCVARLYELDRRATWLLFVLVLMSTPFRVTIGNGQNDALALAAIALWALVDSQGGRGLLLGIAYEKYSFPPVLVIFLAVRQRWKLLLFSMLPPVAGFLLIEAWLRERWQILAVEPFLTAIHRNSVSLGWANIVAVAQGLLRHGAYTPMWTKILPYVLAILLACAFAGFFAMKADRVDGRILLACLLSVSLVCFQHQIYDFLALTFNAAIALKSKPSRTRNIVLILTAYFWYLERIFNLRHWKTHLFVIVPSFLLLLWLIAATYQLWKTTEWRERWEI